MSLEQLPAVSRWSGIVIDWVQQPLSWWQLSVLLTSVLFGWLVHRFFGGWLFRQEQGRAAFLANSIEACRRGLFGLTVALLLALASSLMEQAWGTDGIWLDAVAVLFVALASVRAIVCLMRQLSGNRPLLDAWENAIAALIWGGVALYLLGWLPLLVAALDNLAVSWGDRKLSLLSVLRVTAVVLGMLMLAFWLSQALEQRLNRSRHLSPSLKVGLSKILRVVLLVVAGVVGLTTVGIDLTALTVFSGALGVGIGFGLQRIASNFISGFLLIMDRSIRPGDVITIGQNFGWVQELRARYIVVRSRDGVDTLIPNENLITNEVINWSFGDPAVRLKIPVQISYNDDPEQAMALLEEASEGLRVLAHPPPGARLMGFGDNGIDLELRLWISDPQNGVNNVRSDVNVRIWRAFRDAGITIPFPQRDVYLHGRPSPSADE
jgi:small-conductance mechanosensitive channel